MSDALFVSWHDHRRSRELARMLGIPFVVLGGGRMRQALQTVALLLRGRARVLVVQNPSLLLASIACALMRIGRKQVIQDLHSYFSLHVHQGRGLRGMTYRALSLFCIRRATLTVVTNAELRRVVEHYGGRAMVLQDAIPQVSAKPAALPHRAVVFVCTYSADEPVGEVVRAARLVPQDIRVYVTGRPPAGMRERRLPANVILTGYLPEAEYLSLLSSADAVMALTTRDYTLLCGAYEGLAFQKTLILSDKRALRDYFGDAAVYVPNEAASIARGIVQACARDHSRVAAVVERLQAGWQGAFADLRKAVGA